MSRDTFMPTANFVATVLFCRYDGDLHHRRHCGGACPYRQRLRCTRHRSEL